jgi:hypothetical protein
MNKELRNSKNENRFRFIKIYLIWIINDFTKLDKNKKLIKKAIEPVKNLTGLKMRTEKYTEKLNGSTVGNHFIHKYNASPPINKEIMFLRIHIPPNPIL